ncbi:hypothetical protein HanXRQr2_Chr08g0328581 [Helianthus annuus]|uniref:Uncharacterized protein n=1 Tax=Helianthus annuus TaxID=4232 RepID=A0A9K3NCI1_HELAN|nr:hypothetical protein HanXRQr2_Chr08g0328581 [Helianthus annuus]KAJ0900779.1 hypothetical protein HanPSC8_Chr08g0317631 [Helianthus annuus]
MLQFVRWQDGCDVESCYLCNSVVEVKKILHFGSLNNVMMSVFGRLYDFGKNGGEGLEEEKQEAVCSQRLFLFLTF